MAYTLPNSYSAGESMKHGTDFYNQLVQHALWKAQERRAQEKLPYEIAKMKGEESRAGQARSEAHEKYMREKDPNYEINKFMNDMKILGMQNGGSPSQTGAPDNAVTEKVTPQEQQTAPQQFNALRDMMQNKQIPQGNGPMAQPEEMQAQPESMKAQPQVEEAHPAVVEHLKQNGLDLNNLNPLQQMYMAKKGYKLPGESPEVKRAAENANKIAFEQAKMDMQDQKKAKEIVTNAKADIPKLESSLDAMKRVRAIIKNNPKLFGHWVQGDKTFKLRTDNKNAGIMQELLNDKIINTEKGVSSRGSQLALQYAINQKPNFAEHQDVALGKADEAIRKLEEEIKHNHELAGEGDVIVIDPDGNHFSTTAENAKHLPAGWKHG